MLVVHLQNISFHTITSMSLANSMKNMTPSVYLQGTAAEETTDKRSTISASSPTTSTKKEALTETKVKHEKQNCAKEIP